MEIIKNYKGNQVKLKGTRYFNTMVNIVDLAKITKTDPFDFLATEETNSCFKSLKTSTHYKEVIDGIAIPRQTRAHPQDEVLFIESSDEIYVHPLIAIRFIHRNMELYCWFMDIDKEVKHIIEDNLLVN